MKSFNYVSIIAIFSLFQASAALVYICDKEQITDFHVSKTVETATKEFEGPVRKYLFLELDETYLYYPLSFSGRRFSSEMPRQSLYVRVKRSTRSVEVIKVSDSTQPPNSQVNQNPMVCRTIQGH